MKLIAGFLLSLSVVIALSVVAQTPPQTDAVAPDHLASPRQHPPFPRTGKIVEQYIQEKVAAGELDPAQYEALKQQRNTLRAEIKTLRQSGDQDGANAKMQEMRQLRQQQREYVRNLVQDDPDLRQRMIENRQQVRIWQLNRRQDMLERRMERLRDRQTRNRDRFN